MKTIVYQKDFEEILLEANYPDWFKEATEYVFERTFSAPIFFGNGSYTELFFDGIHISYGNLELINDTLFHFNSDFESVEMHFALNGNTSSLLSNLKNEVCLSAGEHNIFYSNKIKGKSKWSSKTPIHIFEIKLAPSIFKKYIPNNSNEYFKKFKKAITQNSLAMLSERFNFPITIDMNKIINQIINCKRKGVFKRLFLESKVLELLMLQIEQIDAYNNEVKNNSLKKQDVEKIYAVKEILDKNFKHTNTLVELAKIVGTNEFTLKKGFKELFGTSVYNYWKCLRLKTAKTMLLEEQISVKEVAAKIGYKNPQHFTAAFKKEFGVLPSKMNF